MENRLYKYFKNIPPKPRRTLSVLIAAATGMAVGVMHFKSKKNDENETVGCPIGSNTEINSVNKNKNFPNPKLAQKSPKDADKKSTD